MRPREQPHNFFHLCAVAAIALGPQAPEVALFCALAFLLAVREAAARCLQLLEAYR